MTKSSSLDKNLRALTFYIREVKARGTMERGQQEVIERRINDLRRAFRRGNIDGVSRACDKLARVFLRGADR